MLDKNIDELIEMYGKIVGFIDFLEKEKVTLENKE